MARLLPDEPTGTRWPAPAVLRPGRRRVVLAGLIVFGTLATWSIATARYGGPDEPAHVLRAASVASGDLLGRPAVSLDPGYRSVLVPAALTTGDPTCFRHDDDTPAACAFADPAASGLARAASSAGTYAPIYYALVGVPVRILGDESEVLWYRFVSAFWVALVLTAAAVRARRFGVTLLIVCATPAAWFLFGVVNPNSLEIALAVLAWVGVERLRVSQRDPTRTDVAWFAVPISAAILIRPVSALAWLAMMGVLAITMRDRVRETGPRTAHRWVLFGLPVVAMTAAALWNLWAGVDVSDSRTAEQTGVISALWRAVDESTETWREMVGSLGWLEFSAPVVAHAIWWSVAGTAAVLALRGGTFLRRAWLWVLIVFLVGPIAFEVLFASSVGFIWQGRYSIPTGVGLVIVGLGGWRDRLSPRALSLMAVLGAVAHVATLLVVLQRYTVGAHGSWWFNGSAWRPPVPPLAILGADVLLVTGGLWLANRDSVGAFGDRGSVGAFGDLAPNDVQGRAGAEPLDLLRAERVDALEIDR